MGYLLHQLISENAAAHPDNEAVVFKERSISYAELDMETNRLAQGLHHLGVSNGDRVGIYMNRSIESIVSIFGVLKAGATYIRGRSAVPPGPPQLYGQQMRHRISAHRGQQIGESQTGVSHKLPPEQHHRHERQGRGFGRIRNHPGRRLGIIRQTILGRSSSNIHHRNRHRLYPFHLR